MSYSMLISISTLTGSAGTKVDRGENTKKRERGKTTTRGSIYMKPNKGNMMAMVINF
jgi:hypothetical protein